MTVRTILFIASFPSIAGLCAALLAPMNILELFPFLQAGVDVMTAYLPFMAERISASKIPQVLALVYLIGWLFLPMQMILFPYCYFRYADAALGFKRLQVLGYRLWKMRLIVYCSLPIFIFGMTLNGDYHFLWIDPVNTRLGLAMVGGFGFVLLNLLWIQALALTFTNNLDCAN